MCKCKNCGKEEYEIKKNIPKDFCSNHCYEKWNKFNKTPNCECVVCGRKMYLKPSRLSRVKNGITCSKECTYKLKSEYMKGEGNHQFGLKGELNASFKGNEIEVKNHNVIDIMIYVPNHPKANNDGRVRKHRWLIEQNYQNYDINYFENINGFMVLKSEYDVHHIDFNHNNNDISNLQILTRSEHTALHNEQKEIIRNSLGRITGVFKREELQETLEVDNLQPSLELTDKEGSETNS